MPKQGSLATFLKGVYYDEFKWALVKSIGLFALGIRIAQECQGMELLPTQPFYASKALKALYKFIWKAKMLILWIFLVILNVFLLYGNETTAPNFIFILTDDQDVLLQGLLPMQKTLKLVANKGATFTNAFVNSPICCPSRSTILTGMYPHNNGVINNSISGNCSSKSWQANFEPFSIAALLKNAKNYSTFYAGKYLNQYGSNRTGGTKHIPEGYDWWIGLKGNSKYYNYTLSINGTATVFKDKYLTDVLANYSLDFLNQKDITEKPFYMMIAPPAPHAPFTPAERHKEYFPGTQAVRNPAFNHTSKRKHWVVKMSPKFLPSNVSVLDDIQRHRLQSLLAVDEMVEKIIVQLKALSILKKTYIVFASDNGFHIGQFAQPWDKRQPYETDIRIPFLVRGPKIPKKVIVDYPISAVDIAPTILDFAKVDIPRNMDGQSFEMALFQNITDFSRYILIEYWGEGNKKTVDQACYANDDNLSECILENWCKCQDSKNNTYSCVLSISKSENFKFCEFRDNQNYVEAYNLTNDPYELHNIIYETEYDRIQSYSKVLQLLKKCRAHDCNIF